jgi:hypothetical protein
MLLLDCVSGNHGESIYCEFKDGSSEKYSFNKLIIEYSNTNTNNIIYLSYRNLFESASIPLRGQFIGYEIESYGMNEINLTNIVGYNRAVEWTYPMIYFMSEYINNTIYISDDLSGESSGYDGFWCGREVLPCFTIKYGITHLLTDLEINIGEKRTIKIINDIEVYILIIII